VSEFAGAPATTTEADDLINFDDVNDTDRIQMVENGFSYCSLLLNSTSITESNPIVSRRRSYEEELIGAMSAFDSIDQEPPAINGLLVEITQDANDWCVEEFSDEDAFALVNGVKAAMQELTATVLDKFDCMVIALDKVFGGFWSMTQTLPDKVGVALVVYDEHNSVIAAQRPQMAELREASHTKKQHLARFKCSVCMSRLTDAGLDCGHTFCRQCAGTVGDHCAVCRKEIKSILNLFV